MSCVDGAGSGIWTLARYIVLVYVSVLPFGPPPAAGAEDVGATVLEEIPPELTLPADLPVAQDPSGTPLPEEIPASEVPSIEGEAIGDGIMEGDVFDGGPLDLGLSEWPAELESSGTWLRRGFWYVEQDVVLYNRSFQRDLDIAVDISGARFDPNLFRPIFPSDRELEVERDDPGSAASARLTLGRFLFRDLNNRDHMTEFTFLGLGEWASRGSVQSINDDRLMTPLGASADRNAYVVGIGGFNWADTQQFAIETEMNSFEWSYRLRHRNRRDWMELGPDGSWTRKLSPSTFHSYLFGVRYVQTNETFSWQSQAIEGTFFDPADILAGIPIARPRAPANGDLLIRTDNDIVGLQFGGEMIHQRDRWSLGVRGKVGPYVNFSQQRTDLVIDDPTFGDVDEHVKADDASFSFIGELGVFAHYHLHPNWTLRLAYEALWLSSVANAQEQVDFDPASLAQVRDGGGQTYMGFSFGVDFYW
jgi:hypothetical protein